MQSDQKEWFTRLLFRQCTTKLIYRWEYGQWAWQSHSIQWSYFSITLITAWYNRLTVNTVLFYIGMTPSNVNRYIVYVTVNNISSFYLNGSNIRFMVHNINLYIWLTCCWQALLQLLSIRWTMLNVHLVQCKKVFHTVGLYKEILS